MMRFLILAPVWALAGALLPSVGVAAEQCFDKGTLSYVDCPSTTVPAPAATPVVAADPASHFYIGGFGGYALGHGDYETTQTNALVPIITQFSVDTGDGFVAGGVLGYQVLPMFAVELEGSYASLDLGDSLSNTVNGVPQAAIPLISGDVAATMALVNFWFSNDFSGLRPYFGGGVGVGFVDVNDVAAAGFPLFGGSSTSLAYQVGAGVKIEVLDQVDLDLSYRYRGLDDVDVETDIPGGAGILSLTSEDISFHTFQAGLQYKF